MRTFVVCVSLICIGIALGSRSVSGASTFRGNSIKDTEYWNYVNVRENAYMFWWLYLAQTNPATAPIVIWLQGGPGGSSTGFGNFLEIGPLDVNLKPRNVTWVQTANVLFIDNPVGTGYSYTTSPDAFATNNSQIADDLVTTLTAFYKDHPEFQGNPLYIFSESYGGKMTVGFGQALLKAIKAGKINCKFQGVALGDSWISPVDSVNSWGPYLYSISLLDNKGLQAVNTAAKAVEDAVNQGKFAEATEKWNTCEDVVEDKTDGVNFYNILSTYGERLYERQDNKPHLAPLEKLYRRHVLPFQQGDLNALMNGPIKKKLGIPENVTWGGQSGEVFQKLSVDFMKPVYSVVDSLLDSDLNVTVYSGQLDLIVDTVGTEVWVQKLKWNGLPAFNDKTWAPIQVYADKPAAFVKSYRNFAFYWIMKAGHMVPSDAPGTAYKMMQMVTNLI
ncbi:retinoid-inducible serine carboxypeptidase-like [Patiria miniata]|uniref:Carboxypeptidase n=1 Tax=Patiria miniata TaxID=46514 RepID=A0A914AYA4_PATMI|nr:retinoid-inducible serine carboxypeptidase-like [Patiria miniata]